MRVAKETSRQHMVEFDKDHPTYEDLEVLAEASQLLTVVDLDQVLHKVIEGNFANVNNSVIKGVFT